MDNYLSNVVNSVNEKDAIGFKSSLTQALNNRLFAAIETRKNELAKEILGEKSNEQEVSEANILAPTAPPVVGVKKKVNKNIVPPAEKTEAAPPAKSAKPAVDPEAKAKADLLKAKAAQQANKAKLDAVEIKKNVLGPKELDTMRKQIDAVMDNSVDLQKIKPVPGGFEITKQSDDGLNPSLDKEFLVKTFKHNGKIVELKQVGLGISRPIRVYIDGTRWNFFPGMESAISMTKEYIEMTSSNNESVEPNGTPISEKVDLDGRTRLVRDTMSRLEAYRKFRMEKMKKMQEEEQTGKKKYKGLYDDGSGKGAFIPEPHDTNKPVHPFFKRSVTETTIDNSKKSFAESIGMTKGQILDATDRNSRGWIVREEELSPAQKKYRAFFQSALKKFNVKNPSEMDDAKKKEFFNYVKRNYKG
jgi:hypothetical protein